jgi:hypothetical protein
MKEDIFDNIIKDKLDGFTAIPKTDDVWSAFESSAVRINQKNEATDTSNFDQIIKNSLQNVVPAYRAEHWQILKSQLKTIEDRKNTVFISKIMEFAAIFLIVFTFFHWSGWIDNSLRKEKIADPMLFAHIEDAQSIKSNKTTSHTVVKNKPVTKNIDIKSKNINQQATIVSTTPNNRLTDNNPISDLKRSLVQENKNSSFTPINDQVIAENASSDVDPTSIISDLQKSEYIAITENFDQNKNKTVTVDEIGSLTLDSPASEFALAFPMTISSQESKPEYALSIYGSGDINLINTPFDKLYSRASYNKEALNNSYGMSVSKKINKFEMELGLGYAHREYQPDIFREAFGLKENYYSEISLNKISFDIATIPLNFKYHFINQSSWGAYIMAGAALNLVMNADYEKAEKKILGRPAPERYLPDEARLSEKPFIDGLLAGESFKDNYFASVVFGFGIQKKIYNNTSIYVQPSYQRQILSGDIGIGPNKDKIHTSSLQFGVKTILN